MIGISSTVHSPEGINALASRFVAKVKAAVLSPGRWSISSHMSPECVKTQLAGDGGRLCTNPNPSGRLVRSAVVGPTRSRDGPKRPRTDHFEWSVWYPTFS